MVFGRKRHKLPKFPEHIIPGFERMCVSIPPEQVNALRMELFDYMGRVEKEHGGDPMVNLGLAREIAQAASYLLDRYEEFKDSDRGLIVAAVKYFLSDGDGVADFQFASGLIDDAQVMNHVLEELGIKDKFIDIDRHRY